MHVIDISLARWRESAGVRVGPRERSIRIVILALTLLAAPAAAQPAYTTGPATVLPSTDTGWDYITLDPATHRLFMARRKDGLTVFDVNTRQVIATVENSIGANGVVLVPAFGRAYTAMTDGTLLIFDLATLKPIERIRLDDGDLNQGFYDPATQRVHMVVGARPDRTTWISLDAATGKILGRTVFDSKKMDDPAVDGNGLIYAPMRDRSVMNVLDSATLAIKTSWPLGPCIQPVAIELDHATSRLLIACRGEKPVFLALDIKDGRIVATLPIGRGVDGLVHDASRHLIVTANGVDGTLTIIKQSNPDSYTHLETTTTRSMARVLALDPATHHLFTVTAAYSTSPGNPPTFHPNTFTVQSFAP